MTNDARKTHVTLAGAIAILMLGLLACKEGGSSTESSSPGASAATESVAPDSVAPGKPQVKQGFRLRFGPAVSAADPKPADFKDSIPAGFVSMRFDKVEGDIGLSKLKVSLYRVTASGKNIETQKTSALDPTMDYFAKSWEISEAARYEVKVEDPTSDEVLATGQFDVTK
jgi:hypothetical protein